MDGIVESPAPRPECGLVEADGAGGGRPLRFPVDEEAERRSLSVLEDWLLRGLWVPLGFLDVDDDGSCDGGGGCLLLGF